MKPAVRFSIQCACLAAILLPVAGGVPVFSADDAPVADSSGWWNGVLILVVFATAAGSAVLPVSAARHWQGYWKLVAALPLVILAIWCGWIIIARLLVPASHQLWLLEIFAWAMLTMLYMATVMIAKRQFEKADNPDSEL